MTGHFCFRQSGLLAASSHTDNRNVHLFYSSDSPSALASDAVKRVVNHAVARNVSAVHSLSSNTPLSLRGKLS